MSNYIKNLPNDARPVKNALCWVDRKGNIYGVETRKLGERKHKHYGEYFKYQTTINSHNGYVYAPIKYIIDKKQKKYQNRQRRLHIIVAETFLENPNDYPIVGHKNNIKNDNRVENLYWTTYSENTQKAVDDKLLVNDKGYEDSQSHPVVMFDTYTNKEIERYGSAREASKCTKIPLNTIMRQAKYKKPVRKPFYFRFQDDKSIEQPTIVIQYNMKTDEEMGRYWNTSEASRQTGINSKNILYQCKKGRKPEWTGSNSYFLYSK